MHVCSDQTSCLSITAAMRFRWQWSHSVQLLRKEDDPGLCFNEQDKHTELVCFIKAALPACLQSMKLSQTCPMIVCLIVWNAIAANDYQ
jgi:hypothetical protein